jgi:nitronate monooxygenase
MTILERLGMRLPIIQAPMAGTSTPAMAAAVSNAGGLGSLGVAAVDAAAAGAMISELRTLTNGAFNINVFVHRPGVPDPIREAGWLAALTPLFLDFDAEPPHALKPPFKSFVEDDDMLAMLLETRPAVVSFHFGVPSAERIAALKQAGCILFSSATSLDEAEAARKAGIDAVVAQGYEAGGHRGVFDTDAPDDRLGTMALTRLLAKQSGLPVIAAGGIMDGAGIAAVLKLGAVAAQLGTAFIACPESSADEGYRAALASPAARHTVMTPVISGRPARCLANRFTRWGEVNGHVTRPDYPIVYDAGKALNAAAKAGGDYGYGAQWAGQGAPLSRPMPAAELVATLARELDEALSA